MKKSVDNYRPVYVSDHLPVEFLRQKKALMPQFKIARNNSQKTYWRAENGNYVLYIDGVKITAPQKC